MLVYLDTWAFRLSRIPISTCLLIIYATSVAELTYPKNHYVRWEASFMLFEPSPASPDYLIMIDVARQRIEFASTAWRQTLFHTCELPGASKIGDTALSISRS